MPGLPDQPGRAGLRAAPATEYRAGNHFKGRAEDDLRQRLALERIPIPLVLVLDEEFNLLGRFVERPQAVLDGGPQALAAYKAGDYLEHAIGDVLAIIEGAAR